MTEDAIAAAISEKPQSTADDELDPELVEETLVEEVSIDGMCGVY